MVGTIENNMIVERTSRDEGHADADLTFGNFSVYADGRFRKRALITLSDDPQFQGVNGQLVTPGLAYDVTAGLRDRGSLFGLRMGLWFTHLADYRSKSEIFGLNLGRSFYDERLGLDVSFLYSATKDALANQPTTQPCNITANPPTLVNVGTVNQACYGTRAGDEYETGITISAMPSAHWFLYLDYRLVVDTSGGYIVAPDPMAMTTPLPQPTMLTHVLLLRLEARY